MKKLIVILLTLSLFSCSHDSLACVGRILTIGTLDSLNENLLARLVSVLIDERTGTTVDVKVFNSAEEIYEAVKRGEIGMVIENTDRALLMLNIEASGDRMKDYDVSRKEFRERLNLVWLKPFGYLPDEKSGEERYYAPVVTEDVLINFPALPRVVNKLKGVSDDRDFRKAMESIEAELTGAVRDFLKKKKLI